MRVIATVSLLALCCAALPARAQEYQSLRTRFVIANEDCFVVREGHGGLSPQERMDRINERVPVIISREVSIRPHRIRSVRRGGAAVIYVGRTPLVTVTARDARANGARSASSLASIWVRNLREAFPEARP